ncbi:hypothetical protein LX32DRAFT_668873 [Colletotrichum zoysiae]|uniref:Uncharacterized protein n=1 Tax=Colletotrichum zoysiae TaxID=1216348 RepID=A0AAD9H277_9PEZI|nr:hypothetical protein LX32DRAFT_668873 [Colletotrichum zoysiae]
MMRSDYLSPVFLFLALGFLSITAQAKKVTIGYRTASQVKEALEINRRNRPFRDPEFDWDWLPSQIGHGVYLGRKPASWGGSPMKVNWYCVIKADEHLLKAAPKIWIPKYYGSRAHSASSKPEQLWGSKEQEVAQYVKAYNLRPDETLRFSYIAYRGDDLQMVIPTKLANADSLGLFGKCFKTGKELLAYENDVIHWEKWNIQGNPGEPDEREVGLD